jgi:hypothetical protein
VVLKLKFHYVLLRRVVLLLLPKDFRFWIFYLFSVLLGSTVTETVTSVTPIET